MTVHKAMSGAIHPLIEGETALTGRDGGEPGRAVLDLHVKVEKRPENGAPSRQFLCVAPPARSTVGPNARVTSFKHALRPEA